MTTFQELSAFLTKEEGTQTKDKPISTPVQVKVLTEVNVIFKIQLKHQNMLAYECRRISGCRLSPLKNNYFSAETSNSQKYVGVYRLYFCKFMKTNIIVFC
jgi:hypothetical protein